MRLSFPHVCSLTRTISLPFIHPHIYTHTCTLHTHTLSLSHISHFLLSFGARIRARARKHIHVHMNICHTDLSNCRLYSLSCYFAYKQIHIFLMLLHQRTLTTCTLLVSGSTSCSFSHNNFHRQQLRACECVCMAQ